MSVQIDGSTGNIIAIKADYSGDVSIGGTLTYEDVTNIDAVGLITARNGIKVDDLGVQVGTGATIDGATNTLTFLTNGSERLRVTSAGLVGIGTDSPSSTLTLDNASGAELGFDYAGASHGTINVNSAAMYVRAGTGKLLILGANGTESARITSAGQMGLGTNDPNSYGGSIKLAVANTSGTCGVSIVSSTSGDGNLYYADGTSGDATYRGFIRYNHTTDQFRIGVAGAEKLRISSDGNVGIKNTVAATIDAVNSAGTLVVGDGSSAEGITIYTSDSTSGELAFADATSGSGTQRGRIIYAHGDNSMRISTNGSEVMRLDSSGRLLINHSSSINNAGVASKQQITGDSAATASLSIRRDANSSSGPLIIFGKSRSGALGNNVSVANNDNIGSIVFAAADGTDVSSQCAEIKAQIDGTPGSNDTPGRLVFMTASDGSNAPTERMRIDSSGRLLVGATSSEAFNGTPSALQIEGSTDATTRISLYRTQNDASGSVLVFAKARNTSHAQLQDDDTIGKIEWYGADGNDTNQRAAIIAAEVDGAATGNDMPGRLVFSTTPDGTATPVERARLDNAGNWLVGKTNFSSTSISTAGAMMMANGRFNAATDGGSILNINRLTNDGNLCQFYQDTNIQGSISVSGSTVSYNGAHLARWSQLPGGAERTEILRGSVLSNLDEMCEWGDENNEQLNRMKVSDVEGDINVAGVFQNWDDDDDTYTNDFYCAMTGDFVIRIASGVTVQRGNLLMSAGDGTAKPQGDGYIQDKTIAKVTSTTVSTTYSDGSYCVPCVLMAC